MLTELLLTWTKLSQQRREIAHKEELTAEDRRTLTHLNASFDEIENEIKAEIWQITNLDDDDGEARGDYRRRHEVSGNYGPHRFYLKMQPDRLLYIVSARADCNPKDFVQPGLAAEDIPEGVFILDETLFPENADATERLPRLVEFLVWYGCRDFHKWLAGIPLLATVSGKFC